MLRVILTRAILLAAPFVAWFIWREVARRTGREPGSTPWSWLAAISGLLVGLSLLASAAFQRDTRDLIYVPGEATSDGTVSKGHFEQPAVK